MSVAQQCEGLLQRGEDQLCVVSGEAERRLDLEHIVLQTVIHNHDPVLLHQPDTYRHTYKHTHTCMYSTTVYTCTKNEETDISFLMCTTSRLTFSRLGIQVSLL